MTVNSLLIAMDKHPFLCLLNEIITGTLYNILVTDIYWMMPAFHREPTKQYNTCQEFFLNEFMTTTPQPNIEYKYLGKV